MVPYVSIVGKSGSGKTSLIERLIKEFKRRGYRVASVKHCPHGMEIDKPGKDSWKFSQAGSDAVVFSSLDKLVFVKNVDGDSSIAEILRMIGGDFDLVLIESYKKDRVPKIEVHRKELGDDFICPTEALSAIITDEQLKIDKPQFPINDTSAIADFIEKNFVLKPESDTFLFVNGKQIPIKIFIKDFMAKALIAVVSTLKGIGEIKNLDICIRNKPNSTVTLSDSERSLSQAAQEDSSLSSE